MDILLIALGLPALLGGGELLVSGAVALALRLGLSPMVIGLTLVGFGTSTPELLTSLRAASQGAPDIALGNVVGSNIANILLILGLAALIRPMAVADRAGFRRDGGWMLAAGLACALLVLLPVIGRGAGLGLLAGLAAFLWLTLRRATPDAPADVAGPPRPLWQAALAFTAGLGLTLLGAVLLVDGATGLARDFGVSEAVIGLTLVAVGTSLPELVTSVLAARRGHGDVALGNILGSNLFNVLGILGATALAVPLPVADSIARVDVWVMLAASLALLVLGAARARIGRLPGLALLISYGAYLAWLSRTLP
ncbi:calcium/sodium antiporter [Thalassococcus sp. BH17M4-6]|uniref:calcium/sodium antiporter n=1 Tax=Thalassococcus sp. BH17M4-6 TaxID=3413148 RepID=UPI003BCEA66E